MKHMTNQSLSRQAQIFLDNCIRDESPTEFSLIQQARASAIAEQTPNAERAIRQHRLEYHNTVINGVECQHITSRNSDGSGGKLLYLFGGGFIVGCPYSDLPIIGALADYCNVEVIAPQYRLAPEHCAPAAADDCMAVWQQLCTSPAPLCLAGESAGGNLAVVVAQQAAAEKLRMPDAIALLSPAVDLRTDSHLLDPTTHADPTLPPSRMEEIASVYAPQRDLTDPSLSPLFGSLEGFPPTIITTGTRDMLLSMCLRLHRQLIRENVTVECRVWDGLWHVFEYYNEYPEADESLTEIAAFLNHHGNPQP
jgi:acetyl esterase/lipase